MTTDLRGELMDFHFASAYERVADTVPDVDAVVQGDRRWTYRRFDEDSARIAAAFEAAGVARGSQVSLYLYNCPEYLLAQQAAFKHGCGPVNVNYRYLDEELAYLVDNSDSEVLVFHSSLGERVDRVRERLDRVRLLVVVRDDDTLCDFAVDFDELLEAHDPQARRTPDPNDVYMLYTGGTTGMPKGVMYRNGVFCGGLYQAVALALPGIDAPTSLDDVSRFVEECRAAGPMVSIPCCPLMHGTGMWVGAMPALHTGGTVVLLEERSFDADELLAIVERERATRLAIVGDAFARPILRALQAAEERGEVPDVSSLRTINSSGAMWSAEVKDGLARFTDAVLVDGLGSSEGGGYAQVTAGRSASSGTTARFTPAPDTLLLDLDDRPLPADSGEPGLLASRTGAFGYYKDPEKTARTFKVIDGAQYVITGDWATRNDDGTITLHGRGSNCINSGGEKIFPEEVEEALKTHPAVDDCLVVGVPDERFGQCVVAVVGCSQSTPTEDELRTHVRDQLAHYKAPRRCIVVDHVQRAPNGKADYGWAREVATSGAAQPT